MTDLSEHTFPKEYV